MLRGALLALSSAGLAITAHALAGGDMPDASLTLVLTALVGWIGSALAERTKGPLGVLAVLGVAQVAMHLVLTELMGHTAPARPEMYLAHAVATVCTAAVLAHAETMARHAVAGLWRLLPVVWRPAPVADAAPVPVLSPVDSPTLSVLFRRVHRRRGPPFVS